MEGNREHVKFFRFRSPLNVKGETDGAGWIFNSVVYIDFGHNCLLPECYTASQLTFGGFGYSELKELPFDEYNEIIKLTQSQASEIGKDLDKMKGME